MKGALKYLSIGIISASALFSSCATTKEAVNTTTTIEQKVAKDNSTAKLVNVDYETRIAGLTDTLKENLKNTYSKYGNAFLKDDSSSTKIYFGIDESGAEKTSIAFNDEGTDFSYSIEIIGGKKFIPSTILNIKKDGKIVASFLDYYGLLGFKTDSASKARVPQQGRSGIDFSKELPYSDQASVQGEKYNASNTPLEAVRKKFNKNYSEILSLAIAAVDKISLKSQDLETSLKNKSIEDQIRNAEILPFETDENIKQIVEEIKKLEEHVTKESDRQTSSMATLQKTKDSLETLKADLEFRAKSLDSARANVERVREQNGQKAEELEMMSSEMKLVQDSVTKLNTYIVKYSADIKTSKDSLFSKLKRVEFERSSLAQTSKDIQTTRSQMENLGKENKELAQKTAELDSLNKAIEKKKRQINERSDFLKSYEAKIKTTSDSLDVLSGKQTQKEKTLDSVSIDQMEQADQPLKMEVKTRHKHN